MRKINEIFYSIQGEGERVGKPTIFVRFSGCNLRCPFCDTDFKSGVFMSDEEILHELQKYPAKYVVFTGGEPSLYIDNAICNLLHHHGYTIGIETNGTMPITAPVDWITLSPKDAFVENAEVVLDWCNEIKLVYKGQNLARYDTIKVSHNKYLQPCDECDRVKNHENLLLVLDYIKEHPEWRISVQLHKILDVR